MIPNEFSNEPTLSEQRAILARARELVDLYWCRGITEPYDQNNCAILAIVRAGGDNMERWQPVLRFVHMHNQDTIQDREGLVRLAYWNDNIAKNKEEVLAVFDNTLAIYDQQLAKEK